MSAEQVLRERANSKCELCSSDTSLTVYEIPPAIDSEAENCVLVCEVCHKQIEDPSAMDANHWHCLSDSMWSEFSAVQIMAWRLLSRIKENTWAQNLLEQLYMDEQTLERASAENSESDSQGAPTSDSTGNALNDGDTVTLIKDLNVKGANFTAKRGTIVKNISLTMDPEQIEGRVNGTQIVLLTKFLKKA